MKRQTIQISDVREFMVRHLVDVFDKMSSMKAIPLPRTNAPQFGERVTGSMGIAGEKVTGSVYLHLSVPLANRMTSAMLGLAPDDIIGNPEVNDAVGEVTNILTGGLKSWICDAGIECATSIPAIIRSTSFHVEPMPDVQRECLVFDCGDDRFVVEIHIKFINPPRFAPTKILTVDDSRIIRMIIGKAFYHYDVRLCEAANGEEGLAAAVRERPKLIILDVTMPVMDGVTMLTKLKEDPAL